MFQAISPSGRVHGPFSSRPVAREFLRMWTAGTGESPSDYKVTAV